jgi:hypothetical protein
MHVHKQLHTMAGVQLAHELLHSKHGQLGGGSLPHPVHVSTCFKKDDHAKQ